jgi:hypothetical protein
MQNKFISFYQNDKTESTKPEGLVNDKRQYFIERF